MDKSLGTLLRFWGVFQFTQVQPLPSPHKQCWTRVSRIFSEIQLCIGWGEGELQENFENDAALRGSREITGKYAYCITVPRTFVHDCSLYEEKCGKGVFEAAEIEVVYNGDWQQQITITDDNYTLYSTICLLIG